MKDVHEEHRERAVGAAGHGETQLLSLTFET